MKGHCIVVDYSNKMGQNLCRVTVVVDDSIFWNRKGQNLCRVFVVVDDSVLE